MTLTMRHILTLAVTGLERQPGHLMSLYEHSESLYAIPFISALISAATRPSSIQCENLGLKWFLMHGTIGTGSAQVTP